MIPFKTLTYTDDDRLRIRVQKDIEKKTRANRSTRSTPIDGTNNKKKLFSPSPEIFSRDVDDSARVTLMKYHIPCSARENFYSAPSVESEFLYDSININITESSTMKFSFRKSLIIQLRSAHHPIIKCLGIMGGSDTLKDFEIDEKLRLRRLLVWEFGSWCCNIYSGPHVFSSISIHTTSINSVDIYNHAMVLPPCCRFQ